MRRICVSSLAFASVLIGGCVNLPSKENAQPNAVVFKEFPNLQSQDIAAPHGIKWREFFKDGQLLKSIEIGLLNNQDLKVAALNIEKSRRIYAISRQNQKPRLNGVAGADFKGVSGDNLSDNFDLGLSLPNYEIDVFGRLKTIEAAREQEFFSSIANQNAVKIAIISAIAKAWVNVAHNQTQINIIKANLSSLNETLKIIEARQKFGVANGLDVSSARAQKYELEASLKSALTNLESDKAQLVLVANTQDVLGTLPSEFSDDFVIKELSIGLPSDVLISRPDIMAIEHQLKAQNANIDNARLARFPTISLTGALGGASGELLSLFKGGNFIFSPNVNIPIFDNGINELNLEIAKLNRSILLSQYDKAIAQAFFEVSDALAIKARIDARIIDEGNAVKELENSVFIAKRRFQVGIDNYLPLLLAQRNLNNAQLNLLQLRHLRAVNMANLYAALGNEKILSPQ